MFTRPIAEKTFTERGSSVVAVPTLALIDGNSIAYRAFYALPEDLATKSGQVTNAVFGFTRMLIRLLKDHHPEGVAVAWDVSRQTFRSERYPEYKAQRPKAPDHFRSQMPLMDEVLQALQISQIRLEGDRKSTRLNSSHTDISRMPSSA